MTHKKSILLSAVFAIAGVLTVSSPTLAQGLNGGRDSMTAEQQALVEERKTAIKTRLETMKTERQEKLDTRRLAACEKRQEKINNIFTKATEQNKKHLAVFQKIEEKVKQFYVDKNLSAEGYDAAVTLADEKEAAAVAAIEASVESTFDCAATDGAKPGSAIKEAAKTRREAIKEYRTAVKDLILVVKKHHGQQQNADTSTETEGGEQ